MLSTLLHLASLGVSPYPNRVGSAQLQCSIYSLAYEFGESIQPTMSASQKSALSDALVPPQNNCSKPSSIAPASFMARPRQSRSAALDAPEVFVDPVHGSDTAAGTVQAPLRTMHAALTLTRKTKGSATMTLRAGTYHLGATLALTPVDSGLTIRSYTGEVAEISGAAPPLAISPDLWEKYDVTPGGGKFSMTSLPNTNVVEGATFGGNNSAVDYMGLTPDAATCSTRCLANANCDAFTWHDPHQPSSEKEWDRMCYFVNHGQAVVRHTQTHHVSGVKVPPPPAMNVWVARGAVPAGPSRNSDGLRINGKRGIRARWPNGNPEYQLFPQGSNDFIFIMLYD